VYVCERNGLFQEANFALKYLTLLYIITITLHNMHKMNA